MDVEGKFEISTETTPKSNGNKMAAAAIIAVVGLVALAGHGPEHGFEEHMPRILLSDKKIFTLAKNSRVKYSTLSGHHQRKLFVQFQKDFGVTYKGDKEEKSRLSHFKEFLELIDARNEEEVAAGGEALHGITKFADLSQTEYEDQYLGTYQMIKEKNLIDTGAKEGSVNTLMKDGTEAKDWTGIYTTSINAEGSCQASYAFTAVEQIESDAVRAGLLDVHNAKLSIQQAISCNLDDEQKGCKVVIHGILIHLLPQLVVWLCMPIILMSVVLPVVMKLATNKKVLSVQSQSKKANIFTMLNLKCKISYCPQVHWRQQSLLVVGILMSVV